MKKKRMHTMFAPFLSTSKISKNLLIFGAFILFGFSVCGQQSVTISDISGAENGGLITVTATLDNAGSGFTVDVSTSDGTATAGSDYTSVISQTLTFVGDENETQTFTVSPTDDTDVEGNETLTVSMGNLAGTTSTVDITDTAIITISNDDSATATITATDDTATEAGTTNNGEFTVSIGLVNSTGSPIVVNYEISTGGANATNTTDYGTIGTSVSIPNGASSATITINPVDDSVVEGTETVILTLVSGTGYDGVGAPSTATVNITDNDSYTATITATDDTATEAGTTNNGEFTVSIGLVNSTGSPIVVNYEI
ncbi:MAG: hypothetical protein ACJAUQ_000345, partial [Maribacter sp.]